MNGKVEWPERQQSVQLPAHVVNNFNFNISIYALRQQPFYRYLLQLKSIIFDVGCEANLHGDLGSFSEVSANQECVLGERA
jgi:hypothetical protein